VLSYGVNKYNNKRGVGTTHAEIDAINHLPPRKKSGKMLINIDLLVIRTSHMGKIGMSKPCLHCILSMQVLPNRKGYKIKNIYYSNEAGDIIHTTLDNLINCKDFHLSRYYKMHNFKFNIIN